MASPLIWTPWPTNVRFRVLVSGVWRDVTRWVTRAGTSISYHTDTSTADSTIQLEAQDTVSMPAFEAWQEWRIDNPTPRTGTQYERYCRAYCADVSSDPQAPIHRWTVHLVGGEVLTDKSPNQIVGPLDYPAGTADNTIIAALVTAAGLASEISTSPSVNHIYNTAQDMTFQNCTLREALQQLQQNAPSGIEVPTWTLYYHQDDPPTHSDDWGWTLHWFQSGLIATYGTDLSDDASESLTTAFYRGLRRQRRGLQVVNRQTVTGQDAVTGLPIVVTLNDTISQTYLSRILAGKPITDTTLGDTASVTARAQLELDRWSSVLENLSGIATLLPGLVNGPMKIRIKRIVEPGLSVYTPYIISRITLAWDAAGLPFYTLDLGTALPELGNSGLGWRGGVRQQGSPVVPPPVTSLHVVSNVYVGATHSVTLIIGWTDPLIGNLLQLWARVRVRRVVSGTPGLWGNWQVVGPIPPGALAAAFPGLPPSNVLDPTDYYEAETSVDVVNTGQQHSGYTALTPFPKLATTAVPLPPTGLTVISGMERAGRLAVAKVGFTLPIPNLAAQWQMEHFVDGGPHTPDGYKPATDRIFPAHSLLLNTYYTFWVRGVTLYGDTGPWGTVRVLITGRAGRDVPGFSETHPDSAEVGTLLGWAVQTFTGTVTPALDTSVVTQGQTSLHLALGTSSSGTYLSDPIAVQAGQVLTYRLWVQASVGTGVTGTFILHWTNPLASLFSTTTITVPALVANTWTLVKGTTPVPAGMVTAAWEVGATTTTNATDYYVNEPLGSDWAPQQTLGTGAAGAFTDLTDTFAAYSGRGGYLVRVNAGETGLEAVSLAPNFVSVWKWAVD